MTRTMWASVIVPALLCGCTLASYPDAGGGAPTATITFSKGHESGFGYSGSQTYSISENQKCTDTKKAAVLLWTTPHSEAAQVAAGRRVVVLAVTTYSYGGPYTDHGTTSCEGAASFVLEAGHTYDVSQLERFGQKCRMSVTDGATGSAPASLKVTDEAACNPDLKD